MNPNRSVSAPSHSGRRIAGRAQRDHILDPYQVQQKLPEPTACGQCGAVYRHGRWKWGRSRRAHKGALPGLPPHQ